MTDDGPWPDAHDRGAASAGGDLVETLTVTAIGCRVVVGLVGVTDDQQVEIATSWGRCDPVRAVRPRRDCDAVAALGRGPGPVPADAGVPHRAVAIRADSVERLAEAITTTVTQLAIDRRRDDLLLLHAGGVADPASGATLAYVAPSGHGKTTASRVLGRAFGYVTDETVAVDDDGVVVGYPKPLSVLGAARPATSRPKAQVPPDALGLLRPPAVPLVLARVVLLDRDPAATEVTVTPVGLADAAERLFPQISYLGARTRPLSRLQSLLDRAGGLLVVRYAEAETLEPVVRALLAEGSSPVDGGEGPGEARAENRAHRASPRARVPGGRPAGPPAAPAGTAGALPEALSATEVDDWVADGDAVVVLIGGVLRTLSGIGVTIWHAARAGRTPEEAADAVVSAHGLPDAEPGAAERGRAAVASAIDELVAAGLLRRERGRGA